ncbi:hypothetical protein BP6252_08645 [Coleophoma cylindrospora]|uniref:Uncharacterized protein n=1 Tax=Coleophoma cylindrospora TaxID=1849047 RepID=A0A3D8R6F0_9HELO|nr:hypothetical protein BP6252_08645 [Coleophoma cylindrospora]
MVAVSVLNPLNLFKKRQDSRSPPHSAPGSRRESKSSHRTSRSRRSSQQERKQSHASQASQASQTSQETNSKGTHKTSPSTSNTPPIVTEIEPYWQAQTEATENERYKEEDEDEEELMVGGEEVYSTYPDYTIPVVIDSLEGFPRMTTDVQHSVVRSSVSSASGKGRFKSTHTKRSGSHSRTRPVSWDFEGRRKESTRVVDSDEDMIGWRRPVW